MQAVHEKQGRRSTENTKTDSTETAFIKARSKYKQLRITKIEMMSNKEIECGTDTRKLYSLVNGLIGLTTQNPPPDNRRNYELVEEFVTFLAQLNAFSCAIPVSLLLMVVVALALM